MYLLTDDQVSEIAEIAIEQYGFQLTNDQAHEAIGLLLEDIPGLETADSPVLEHLIDRITRRYHELVEEIRRTKGKKPG